MIIHVAKSAMARFSTTVSVVFRLKNAQNILYRALSDSSHDIKRPDFQEEVFKGMSSHFPCLEKGEIRANGIKNGNGIKGMYGEDYTGCQVFEHHKPFRFKEGGVLPRLRIAYETWGQLNEDKSNVVLIHTGLSGSSHAKSNKVTC